MLLLGHFRRGSGLISSPIFLFGDRSGRSRPLLPRWSLVWQSSEVWASVPDLSSERLLKLGRTDAPGGLRRFPFIRRWFTMGLAAGSGPVSHKPLFLVS